MCSVIKPGVNRRQAPGQSCTTSGDCQVGEACCNNRCVTGECCANADCQALLYPPGIQCLQNVCQTCTTDAQCGFGEVCCGGSCVAGSCCPGQLCSGGQVCALYQCGPCTQASDCGSGRVCCNGVCEDGNCCGAADCGQYVCRGNSCGVCTADLDCGPGGRCCNGACTTNQCCSSSDCGAGQVCSAGLCTACTNNAQCGAGGVCCGGACKSGNCCTSADCPGGATCNPSGFCGLCSSDAQCGAGQKCCGGACVSGTCCVDSDCGAGQVCTSHSCQACTADADCGRNQVCCNGGCQAGNCCSPTGTTVATPECNGLVCAGSVCAPCTTSTQCGAGSLCCRGACYPGAACCSSADCGGLACLNGACTSCTVDADCGALSCCDDDGAGPNPGRCKAFCSSSVVFSDKGSFDRGSYDGTSAGGSSIDPACTAGVLCWAGSAITIDTPYIWVPWTGAGQVLRYDTNTGAQAGPFNINVVGSWPSASGSAPGTSPSRTAVNPFDSTVWVADRGYGGRSGVAHLDYNGNMLCFADVDGIARALATDAAGNAWVGSFNNATMSQFSGDQFEPGSSNPRQCKLLRTVPIPGNPYGAAVDNNNEVWVQGGGHIVGINANTGVVVHDYPPGCGPYGITVDRDYVWLGCYWSNGISRITKATGATNFVTTGGNPRGIASSSDGYVYAATDSNFVIRMDRQSMTYSLITLPLSQIMAVAVDGANRVWAIDYNGPLVRMNGNGTNQVTIGSGGRTQYTYTDLTGQQTINAGLTPGFWSAVVDSAYFVSPSATWKRVNLDVTKPTDTTVSVRVKVAASEGALASTPWWNRTSPTGRTVPGVTAVDGFRLEAAGVVRLDDITPALPTGRFMQIEVKLTTVSDTVTPKVRSVSAVWTP